MGKGTRLRFYIAGPLEVCNDNQIGPSPRVHFLLSVRWSLAVSPVFPQRKSPSKKLRKEGWAKSEPGPWLLVSMTVTVCPTQAKYGGGADKAGDG